MEQRKAAVQLAQADVVQLRATAMILHTLVLKNLLAKEDAAQIVKQSMDFLPEDHPMRSAYAEVLRQF